MIFAFYIMQDITQVIEVLNRGGIVIYPTDTAFGIGCRIDREDAIKKLFQIRRRPQIRATPVLVSSIAMAQKYLTPLSDNVRHLMEKYWPGGLSIVYPCKTNMIPPLVRGGGATLGVRMPDHKLTLDLIKGVGVPILGPSANFHTQPTPYHFHELDPELTKLVDYVLPGKTKTRQASTVIDCSTIPWQILRQGTVKLHPAISA